MNAAAAIGAELGTLLYLMAPAYAANMAPPLLLFWHGWNRPLHARLLGTHKTVLGVFVGVAAALLVSALQARVQLPCARLDYGRWGLLPGLAMGLGALGGDALKSFFKRRLGIAAGQPWPPFDQLDFVAGSLLLAAPLVHLSLREVVLIAALSFLADLLVNRLSYRLGIKRTPW